MNLDNLCMGCMREKPSQMMNCPYCGHEVYYQNQNKQLPVWTVLHNAYLVGKCLGDGGFGITYIGFDMNLQKKVAIKEYFLHQCADRMYGSSMVTTYNDDRGNLFMREKGFFIEEARVLAQIDEHPGIVKVINYFEENGTAYIVMEFLEGKSLKSYIKERGGRLTVNEALGLIQPVIKALASVHERGIVHRDISPDNIMLTNNGSVKLIDFGAAKTKEMGMSENKVFKQSYSPLEQRQKDGVIGSYSDIYALCATVYEMITGVKVMPATERAKYDQVMLPSQMGIPINPIQEAALMNGLAIGIDERIKNATDLYYFFYVYGADPKASQAGMQRKIKESSTKVIIENMKKENVRRKNKTRAIVAVIIITLIGCMIIMVRKIGKLTSGQKSDTQETIVLSGDEEIQVDSEKDLETLKQEFYDLVNGERKKEGFGEIKTNSELEDVASDCVTGCVGIVDTEDWNEALGEQLWNAMVENGIENDAVFSLIQMYGTSFSVEDVMSDFQATAKANGFNIDLLNCSELGMAIGKDENGLFFWVVYYR